MSDTASPAEEVQQQFEQFKTDALQFWNRAEKLDQKELMTQLKRTAIALGVLGVVGYGVKLVCLPIIQILVA